MRLECAYLQLILHCYIEQTALFDSLWNLTHPTNVIFKAVHNIHNKKHMDILEQTGMWDASHQTMRMSFIACF